MKFTRAQELVLIDLGLQALVREALTEKKEKPARKAKAAKPNNSWSLERRKKFSDTMRKKYAAQRAANKKLP